MTDEHKADDALTPATDARTNATTGDATADSTASGAMADSTADASSATPASEAAETATSGVAAATAAAAATETALTTTAASHATATTSAHDAGEMPSDNVRMRDALEAIKTAVVWLVVIQILTILSPLLRLSLKWTLIVGFLLIASGLAVAALAYRKAQRAQRSIPE